MPIRDIRNNLEPKLVQLDIISTDTTTDGASIDTADYDQGLVFNFLCPLYTDGTYTPVLEESATGAFAGEETAIADANMQGTEAGAAVSAATIEGGILNSIGITGTLRYVRSTIVSASTSTGATIAVTVQGVPSIVPVSTLSA